MTATTVNIIPAKTAEIVQTLQHTATIKEKISEYIVTNTTGAAITFSLNLVNAAGTAGSSNLFISSKVIQPNQTYACPEIIGQTLEVGQFISTIASATGLSMRANAVQYS